MSRTWWINVQCQSIPINVRSNFKHWYQCFSMFLNAEKYFGSMLEIWSGIDRYWSALIIDPACPDPVMVLSHQRIFPLNIESTSWLYEVIFLIDHFFYYHAICFLYYSLLLLLPFFMTLFPLSRFHYKHHKLWKYNKVTWKDLDWFLLAECLQAKCLYIVQDVEHTTFVAWHVAYVV